MARRFKKQITRLKFEKLLNSNLLAWEDAEPNGQIRRTTDGKFITWSKKPYKYVSVKNNKIDRTFTGKSWRELANQLGLQGI